MRIANRLLMTTVATATLLAAAPATAATYLFNLSGPQTVSFSLDSSPTPDVVALGSFFRLDNVSGLVNGSASVFSLGFGSSTYTSNFGFISPTVGNQFIASPGAQLYTGSEAAPTFRTGTFALSDGYTITIGSGVPEPSTWVIMLLGFGLVGGALRAAKRKQKVTVSYA